jgi:hypothetical protein
MLVVTLMLAFGARALPFAVKSLDWEPIVALVAAVAAIVIAPFRYTGKHRSSLLGIAANHMQSWFGWESRYPEAVSHAA